MQALAKAARLDVAMVDGLPEARLGRGPVVAGEVGQGRVVGDQAAYRLAGGTRPGPREVLEGGGVPARVEPDDPPVQGRVGESGVELQGAGVVADGVVVAAEGLVREGPVVVA